MARRGTELHRVDAKYDLARAVVFFFNYILFSLLSGRRCNVSTIAVKRKTIRQEERSINGSFRLRSAQRRTETTSPISLLNVVPVGAVVPYPGAHRQAHSIPVCLPSSLEISPSFSSRQQSCRALLSTSTLISRIPASATGAQFFRAAEGTPA